MDNSELLFSLTDHELTMYSIHRLNQTENQPEYLKQELIRQILLEFEFRTAIDEILDNDIATDNEWFRSSMDRLNQCAFQPENIKQEMITQITLEHKFRTTIKNIIDKKNDNESV